MIDCSHANSNKDHNRQPIVFEDVITQIINGNEGIAGVMLESHINPGNQSLTSDISKLEFGVSITDACVGWDKTKEILERASDQLKS